MANEITVTTTDVRPLNGAIVRRAIADGALAFGDAVYVSGYSGNLPKVAKCDGTAVAKAFAFGIVVAPSVANAGATSVADTEACDVVVFGPVTGFSGMTSGATIWVSDTVGRLSSAVGTKSGVIGLAESPTVAFVRPGLYVVST